MNASASPSARAATLDIAAIRAQFPILSRKVHGKPLVYLDNGATTHKPNAVIAAMDSFWREHNSNVHRGVHTLSQEATDLYEGARKKVKKLLNAAEVGEIVFTRGTTEAINLVAYAYARPLLKKGDEVLITAMEHHSNIVPWQLVCEETGATLKAVPFDDAGTLRMDEFARLLSPRTKIVAVTQVSNALGTVNPVAEIARLAHAVGAVVLVDGAQAVARMPVDVRALGADFYAFSGHKVYGPTGIGVLYGRKGLLAAMPPWMGGGDMIREVTLAKSLYADPPARFEAGTPNIAGAVGLGAAADWLLATGLSAIQQHEDSVLEYATAKLRAVAGVRLIGTSPHKTGALSFLIGNVHPHDAGTILDGEGIAVRVGHHCAQPVMDRFGIPGTCRASLGVYNTREEADLLANAIHRVHEIFNR